MIVVGDCLDVMRTMADGSVDLVVTSPAVQSAEQHRALARLRIEHMA